MKNILIIDDSSFMRNILKDILNEEPRFKGSIQIFEAGGKTEAIKQLKKIQPQVILVDIVMKESETEGVEFIREIQGYFDVNKVIVISSIGLKFVVDECNRLGVRNYLQKPFDASQVIDEVDKALK